MSADSIFAAVAVGVFLLLCVVTWYAVLALKQARQTAEAMEQLLVSARPRIEAAGDQIGSLLGRTNRILAAAEEGRGGGILGTLGQALAGWTAGTQAISMIAAVLAGISQVWSLITQPKASEEAQATTGGMAHE